MSRNLVLRFSNVAVNKPVRARKILEVEFLKLWIKLAGKNALVAETV